MVLKLKDVLKITNDTKTDIINQKAKYNNPVITPFLFDSLASFKEPTKSDRIKVQNKNITFSLPFITSK